MIRSALADYRQVSQQVLPPACGAGGSPELPIPGAPLRAPGVRPVSCWRTSLQGEAVSAWAYRWGDRVVVAYVVPEALFFRQPRVREAVASQGRYTASDGDPTAWGLLGAKVPRPFEDGWRAFYTQQHGDNVTWEILPAADERSR